MTAPRSRTPLRGYPKSFKFENRDQLEEYLSGDRITCLLCGRSFKALASHIKLIHGVGEAEYKDRFGIPWRTGLQSAATTKKKVAAGKRKMELPGERERMERIRKESQAKRIEASKTQRAKAAFLVDEYTDRAIGVHGKTELFDKRAFLTALEAGMTMREAAKHVGYSLSAIHEHKRRDPAFSEMVSQTLETQSFADQARGQALGERFERALRKLFDQGYSDKDAAHKLGVTAMTCNRRTKPWRDAVNRNATSPEQTNQDKPADKPEE